MLQWAFLAQKWDFSLTTKLYARERETLFSLFPGCCHVNLETCLFLLFFFSSFFLSSFFLLLKGPLSNKVL